MNFTCTLNLSPGSKTPEVGWISKIRVFGFNSAYSFCLKYFGMCFSSWLINMRQSDHYLWKVDLFHPLRIQPTFTEYLPGIGEHVDTRGTKMIQTFTRQHGLMDPQMLGYLLFGRQWLSMEVRAGKENDKSGCPELQVWLKRRWKKGDQWATLTHLVT